jgi:hypothetical protein
MRRPVSPELRDSRITSTGGTSPASLLRPSSFCTSGKATPGFRISFS